jgi:FkbM family methyltransferase
MMRRIQLLAQSLRRRTLAGPPRHWLHTLLAPPCRTLARGKIASWTVRDAFLEVRLDGVDGVLFIDERIRVQDLYQTIAEQMYPWQWHFYETPETTVGPDDIVLDVGCAEGIFPFLCRGRAKRLYCFEPLPLFLAGLRRTFADDNRVEIIPHALGSEPATLYLRDSGIGSSLHLEPPGTPTRVTTLDEFCASTGVRPTYLKADLEGFELRMLQGARETIRRNRPKVAIATYHKPDDAREIAAFLKECRPDYHILTRGIEHETGCPVLLHAW